MKTPLFAARLKTIRERANLSQSDLGRRIGISPQAVQKWEAGASVPREGKRKQIALALTTTVTDLVRGTELEHSSDSSSTKEVSSGRVFPLRPTAEGAPKSEDAVPLISWAQAAKWGSAMGNIRPEEVQDWLLCPLKHGPGSFVLEVAGESNYDPGGPKSYAPGEMIYVDPTVSAGNRNMVIVRIDGDERAQLKQLLMDEGGTKLLKVLNPNWPTPIVPLADHIKVIGVVIGKWVPE
jgi:SOS-response transcriptional repressor LexA